MFGNENSVKFWNEEVIPGVNKKYGFQFQPSDSPKSIMSSKNSDPTGDCYLLLKRLQKLTGLKFRRQFIERIAATPKLLNSPGISGIFP